MLRSLDWVAAATGGSLLGAVDAQSLDVDLSLAQTDSRECAPGSIYVARVGENTDGHDFAEAAVEAGAVALVVERELPVAVPQVIVEDGTRALGDLAKHHLADLRTRGPIQVAGITGSAGKTTTKDLLARILSASGPTVAPILSFNNEVGCPLTILKAGEDTRFLVLEMGASGPGHIRYLTSIAPLDAAVVLLVGTAHLGGFGSVEVLAASKQELVEGLVPGGTAVLNLDDPHVAAMAGAAPGPVEYFSVSGDARAEFAAENLLLEDDGCPSFVLTTPDFRGRVSLRIAGLHQVSNALAATACNFVLGRSTINAVRVLETAAAVSPHRMALHEGVEVQLEGDGAPVAVTVLDDSYNANPDSMRASLEAGKALRRDRRLLLVLGEMLELGEASGALHRELAAAVADTRPDVVVAVGSGAAPLLEGLAKETETVAVDSHGRALEELRQRLQPGDFVLLKGSYGSQVWRVADSLTQTA